MRALASALLLLVASSAGSAETRGVGTAVWRRMKPILLAHIQRNIRENEGFFFIEDSTRRNAFMGQPKRVYRKQTLRPGKSTYIVRVLFEEQAFENPGRKAKGNSSFLVDFTVSSADGRSWAVKDQAVYAYNKKVFYKYDDRYRRVPATNKDGVLTITIERDEPEEEEESLDAARAKKQGEGPKPSVDFPQPAGRPGPVVPEGPRENRDEEREGEGADARQSGGDEEGGAGGFNPSGPDAKIGPSRAPRATDGSGGAPPEAGPDGSRRAMPGPNPL